MKIKCLYCDELNCICDSFDKLIAGRKKNWSEDQKKKCYEDNLKLIEKISKKN